MDKVFTKDELAIITKEQEYIKRLNNSKNENDWRMNEFHKLSKEYHALKHEYERTKYALEMKATSSTVVAKIEQRNSKVETKIKNKTYSIDEKIEMTKLKIAENKERQDNEVDAIRKKYLAKMEAEINAINTRCNNYSNYLNTQLTGFAHQKGIVFTDLSGNIVEPSSFDEDAYPVLTKMRFDLNKLEKKYKFDDLLNRVLAYIRETHNEQESKRIASKTYYTPEEDGYVRPVNSIVSAPAPAPAPVEDDNVSVKTDDSVSDDTEYDSDHSWTESDMNRRKNRMRRRCAIEEKQANRQAIKEAREKQMRDKAVIENKPKKLSLNGMIEKKKSKTQK